MWHVSSRIAVWQPCELLYTCYLLTACHHITHYYHHHLPPHNDITSDTVRTPYQWRHQGEGRGGKLPPYGWTSKNYVIYVCFHCHGTSSYHTTNTLQDRRAKSHVDTRTIQPGLGDFVLKTPYRPIPHFPPVTKSWRRHCSLQLPA